jgi:hypothetical protein
MQTQTDTVLRTVELMARTMAGSEAANGQLVDAIYECLAVEAPEFFVTSGLTVNHEFVCEHGCASPEECLLPGPAKTREEIRQVNTETLGYVREHLVARGHANGKPALLLGDGAVLLGLYGCLGAFEGSLWIAGIHGEAKNGERSVTLQSLTAAPAEVRVAPCGKICDLLKTHTKEVEAAGQIWRVPVGELQVVLLAARVGDPESSPLPPFWVHLALALGRYKGKISWDEVHRVAQHLNLEEQVARGLAVEQRLMPWVLKGQFVKPNGLPLWERALAVPLAAKRLLREAVNAA